MQVDIDFDGTIKWNGALVAAGADLEKHMAEVAGATKIGLIGNEQYMQ